MFCLFLARSISPLGASPRQTPHIRFNSSQTIGYLDGLDTGFVAKFAVIGAAVEARSFWLAIVAMVTAVVSAFLYLRIVLSMYLGRVDDDAVLTAQGWPLVVKAAARQGLPCAGRAVRRVRAGAHAHAGRHREDGGPLGEGRVAGEGDELR